MGAYATEMRSLVIVDMVQSIIHCSEELMFFVILGSKLLKLEVRFLRNLAPMFLVPVVALSCGKLSARRALGNRPGRIHTAFVDVYFDPHLF